MKKALAELAANYINMTTDEFINSKEAKKIYKSGILPDLEKFKLPEITRLIVSSDYCEKEDFYNKYKKVKEVYEWNYYKKDSFQSVLDKYNLDEIKKDIIPYLDDKMMSIIKNEIDSIKKAYDENINKKCESEKKIKHLKSKKSELDKVLNNRGESSFENKKVIKNKNSTEKNDLIDCKKLKENNESIENCESADSKKSEDFNDTKENNKLIENKQITESRESIEKNKSIENCELTESKKLEDIDNSKENNVLIENKQITESIEAIEKNKSTENCASTESKELEKDDYTKENVNLPDCIESKKNNDKVDNENKSILTEIEKIRLELSDVKTNKKKIETELINVDIEKYSNLIPILDSKINGYDDSVNPKRKKAFSLLEESSSNVKKLRKKLRNRENLKTIDIEKLKDINFCNELVNDMKNDYIKMLSIEEIAYLYNQCYIDIIDDPFKSYIIDNITTVMQYVANLSSDSEDYSTWKDIIKEYILQEKNFFSVNMCISTYIDTYIRNKNEMETLINKVLDLYKTRNEEALIYFLYNTTNIEKRNIIVEIILNKIFDSRDIAMSQFIDIFLNMDFKDYTIRNEVVNQIIYKSECIQENKNDILKKLEKNNKTLKNSVNSIASDIYSNLHEAIEKLEENISNIKSMNGKSVKKEVILMELYCNIARLRIGLENLGIYSLANIEDWVNSNDVIFNPEFHELMGEKGDFLRLRTLGFVYNDIWGEEKIHKAKVFSPIRALEKKPEKFRYKSRKESKKNIHNKKSFNNNK